MRNLSLANRVVGASLYLQPAAVAAMVDAGDAVLVESKVEKQAGLLAPRRDVDELLHPQHPLHGDAVGVISEDLVKARGEQEFFASPRAATAERDDIVLLHELIAYLLGQALQAD